ncbi:MAG: LysR family transcriptional regulator [Candidatus Howiella sp.]
MDIQIGKIFALIKAVECGSFTKAAEALSYTQSGVSRMIGDLEREWGITLLERGRGGVRPTSDGVKLLPFARRICEDCRELQNQVDALGGLQAGLIRIGTFSSVATHWLPNIIKAFQADYPNVEYELLLGDYTEIESWILEGRVDCGFLRLPAGPGLETVFLEQDRLLAVLPEGHPLAGGDRFPVTALCEEPFLLLEKGEKAEISAIFDRCGLTPQVRFTTWDDYAVMSMVESGLGISVLPELILKRVPYRIVTRELSIPAFRNIGFAMRDKKAASLAVRRFMEYLQYR